MNILKTNKGIVFSIICSIVVIAAIFIEVFEPFTEIPFIYNQF